MARYFRRKKFCRFTAEGVKEIDYKDLAHAEGATSPRPAKSCRAVSPARARRISASLRPRSSARASLRCCLIRISTSQRSAAAGVGDGEIVIDWLLAQRQRLVIVAIVAAPLLPILTAALLAFDTARRGVAQGVVSALFGLAG